MEEVKAQQEHGKDNVVKYGVLVIVCVCVRACVRAYMCVCVCEKSSRLNIL